MLVFLDYFFTIFHGALAAFNAVGWAWKKTRRLHLVTSGLTMLSWFGLGLLYGWGYCPCTDWHWQVKRELGERDLPASYIKYHVDQLTGLDSNPVVVDTAVAVIGVMAFLLSCWLNFRDVRRPPRDSDRKV